METNFFEKFNAEGTYRSFTLNLFGVGPMWSFQCRSCGKAWSERLCVGHDNPLIKCPNCSTNGRIPIEWGSDENNALKER